MAERVTNVWTAVIHDVLGGKPVELVTEPEEIPAVAAGETFTISWDSRGVARFELAKPGADAS